jgi:microsomal dipeptidase-like Zn-dependent dipeptidase
MSQNTRRKFVQNTMTFIAGMLLLPKLTRAFSFDISHGSMPALPMSAETTDLFHKYAIYDLHCHPSLKMHLWGKKFWKRHLCVSKGSNLLAQQEDQHQFEFGYVRGILATHYLLEGNAVREWRTLRFAFPFIKFLFPLTAEKIEHEDSTNTAQVIQMMDLLEYQLSKANSSASKYKYLIARNFKDFLQASSSGSAQIPVAHAIEGAHALGRNLVVSNSKQKIKDDYAKKTDRYALVGRRDTFVLPQEGKMDPLKNENAERYIANLKRLFECGVCMITLSHFYCNDLSFAVEGMSPEAKKLPGVTHVYNPIKDNKGLTKIGIDVVNKMLELGVIVDLTHATPKVRQDVYAIRKQVNAARRAVGKHDRPLVYSHVGSQEIFDLHDHGMYPDYKYYNVSREEILELSCEGGVMGIIPEIFWLAGSNRAVQIPNHAPFDEETGIPYIIETMKALNKYTAGKDYDNIALGTDFDGLADNPKDLYLNEHLPQLFKAMEADPELKIGNRIQKITRLNSLRLLQAGWGEADQTPIQ